VFVLVEAFFAEATKDTLTKVEEPDGEDQVGCTKSAYATSPHTRTGS
jgi:hypothetical protein